MHLKTLATLISAASSLRTNTEKVENGVSFSQAATGVSVAGLTMGLMYYRQKYNDLQVRFTAMKERQIELQAQIATINSIRTNEVAEASIVSADLTIALERERVLKEKLLMSVDAKEKVEMEQLYWVNQINAMQDRIYRLEAELNGSPVYPITQPQPPTAGLQHLSSDMRSQLDFYRRNRIRVMEEQEEHSP